MYVSHFSFTHNCHQEFVYRKKCAPSFKHKNTKASKKISWGWRDITAGMSFPLHLANLGFPASHLVPKTCQE